MEEGGGAIDGETRDARRTEQAQCAQGTGRRVADRLDMRDMLVGGRAGGLTHKGLCASGTAQTLWTEAGAGQKGSPPVRRTRDAGGRWHAGPEGGCRAAQGEGLGQTDQACA